MATEGASDGPTLLKRGLELAAGSGSAGRAWVSITIPAQPGSGASLLELWPGEPAIAYGPWVGIGIAAQLRLDRLDAAAAKDWVRQVWAGIALADREPPPILCGAAFSPGSTGKGRWTEFPAFALLLPRWTHWQGPDGARLSFTAPAESLRAPRQRAEIISELEQLTARLGVSPPARRLETQPPQEMPPGVWGELVAGALEAIQSNRFQKLVVARGTTVRASGHWSEAEVFDKLHAATGCVAFAVRFGKATFLGATPERLIERNGDVIRTEALAGTAPRAAGGVNSLQSAKNRSEHQLVVDEIERRLRPLCAELSVATEPRPRHLKDVVHLQTPIEGRVEPGAHLLDLACALHPTPAIAGIPSSDAVEWITAHEPEARGWYAGFVGWFDQSGDGELSVSIRSGLLSEDEAVLYTGAGIVAGSDPSAEYLETAWKQRPFLRALGIELPA